MAHAREVLPTAPSKWYLAGFLVPYGAPARQRTDDTADEELDQQGGAGQGDDEEAPERGPARRSFFPSSMGLSVLVPAGTEELALTLDWGDYEALPSEGHELKRREDEEGTVWGPWRREPRAAS
ncbi:MAG: hypothetical protein FJ125_09750 [Deltaproteobacteria bacterium]|nr:hypothetical protein [Deltaproteobacteria bacterium]